jgi:hypothetical protein
MSSRSNAAAWDERFSGEVYAYGKEPNVWLKERIESIPVSTENAALFPADGEGRNAVWAATKGWKSHVFDLSTQGRRKCELLAREHGVTVEYDVDDLVTRKFEPQSFDLIACSWFHTPSEIRSVHMPRMLHALKVGGNFIMEGYHTSQLPLSSGGPKSLDLLFDLDTIVDELTSHLAPQMDIVYAKVESTELDESDLHRGHAKVVRIQLERIS